MASAAPGDGVQNEPPRDIAVRARAASSASAVVVMSASMRERAVFIGSMSVLDTIGTLPPFSIEIVKLFRPVYCCVMGRKALGAWRAAIRRAPRVLRTHPNVSRRSAHPSFGVSEARMQTPGAKVRRGNEMGCLKSE